MTSHRLLWLFLLLPLASCDCSDAALERWDFYEPYPEDIAHLDDADPILDTSPLEDALDEFDIDMDAEPEPPDAWIPPDIERDTDWNQGEWTAEIVDDNFSPNHALNDRTSLIVDELGTMWLGYHSCANSFCTTPQLTVANRFIQPITNTNDPWQYESVQQPHSGIFGLEVIQPDAPIAVYPDPRDNQLRVAHRSPINGVWQIRSLNLIGAGNDGFDVTRDRARFYVSFANSRTSTVDFLVYNSAAAAPRWQRLPQLTGAYSAAYERGLRADNQFNLYLVHRRSQFGTYGIARYSLAENAWTERSYLPDDHQVSSLLIRHNGDLCMSSTNAASQLIVTCGDMQNLTRERKVFSGERVTYFSSMVEGSDGTLFVAYHNQDNNHLRVARRTHNGQWTTETAFSANAYGVSTAVNHREEIALSFYTCQAARCSVQVLEKTYDF